MLRFVRKLRWAAALLVAAAGIFILSILATVRAKSIEVREKAVDRYGGDAVAALTQMVDDSTNTFNDRNYAIGMLANLSDARALPVLERHWDGSDDAECGGGHARLCQYELKKAITRSRENTGPGILTRFMQ